MKHLSVLEERTTRSALWKGTKLLALFLLCGFFGLIAAQGQTQPALTLDQVKKLVTVGAPDPAVAREIQTRGVVFTPSREILAQLQSAGAGNQTLAALHDLMPMLDEAKREIPHILQILYPALDQGNPAAARTYLASALVNNAGKLDEICKPFSYRGHYVEAIIERPQRRFEARVHVLFKPLEERAYILWFGLSGNSFQLMDVAEPDNDWFQTQIAEAEQLVRKFIFAVNAQRLEVAQECVAPSLVPLLHSSPALEQIRNDSIATVTPNESTRIFYYKGQKIRANFRIPGNQPTLGGVYTFILDKVGQGERIVAWAQGDGRDGYSAEDPRLEYSTLQRFGISAPLPVDRPPQAASRTNAPGSMAGHYVNSQNSSEYVDLGPDNKFFLRERGQDYAGTYAVNGDTVTLQLARGRTARARVDGERLIDDENKTWVLAHATPTSDQPIAQKETKSFAFRHRHVAGFGMGGNVVYYCWGTLTIAGDGTVRYDCAGTNDPRGRCDHVSFTPGTLDQAQLRSDGALRLATKGSGHFDFYGNAATAGEAAAAIAPFVKH